MSPPSLGDDLPIDSHPPVTNLDNINGHVAPFARQSRI